MIDHSYDYKQTYQYIQYHIRIARLAHPQEVELLCKFV